VPEVEPLVRILRKLALDVASTCREALLTGVAIERVHAYYFRRMHELVDEAEAQALLATSGGSTAVAAIESCLAELGVLADELADEMPHAAGDESDD
jgi:hypothetical protein